jgi:hypothetical protein
MRSWVSENVTLMTIFPRSSNDIVLNSLLSMAVKLSPKMKFNFVIL